MVYEDDKGGTYTIDEWGLENDRTGYRAVYQKGRKNSPLPGCPPRETISQAYADLNIYVRALKLKRQGYQDKPFGSVLSLDDRERR